MIGYEELRAATEGFVAPLHEYEGTHDLELELANMGLDPSAVSEIARNVGEVHVRSMIASGLYSELVRRMDSRSALLLAAEVGSAFAKGLAIGVRLGRFFPEVPDGS